MTARFHGFLEPVPAEDRIGALAARWAAEGRTLHAIYDDATRPVGALGDDVPVATLATFTAGLAAGGDEDIPCTLVADVTVRATHQGQGLMRRLMDAAAHDAATPLMALHAAHPARYARFGFAPAIRSACVEVDCARFRLRDPAAGTVHEAGTHRADELARAVAMSSAVLRFGALTPALTGAESDDGARCLVHTDDRGVVDGVLTWAFLGWTPRAQVIEVRAESYATVDAHAALWQTLCSTGIASTIRAADSRLEDPVAWMIEDRAARRVTAVTDGYSLRVLDPARALAMRGYSCPDTSLVIEVADGTGAASGRWLLAVTRGRATVEPTARAADVRLGARELAALFLAGTRADALHAAGLLADGRDARILDDLLRWPVEARSGLHF